MDYIATKEDGHWKCILITNMYFIGDLRKDCELTLCYIPKPLFSLLTYFFGETTFKTCPNASCSRCGAVFTCLVAPFAFALALVIVTVIMVLIVAFLPVFVVAILPCVLLVKCRQPAANNVLKIVDDGSNMGGNNDGDKDEDVTNANAGDEGEEIPLKPKANTTPIIITSEPKPANGGACKASAVQNV